MRLLRPAPDPGSRIVLDFIFPGRSCPTVRSAGPLRHRGRVV